MEKWIFNLWKTRWWDEMRLIQIPIVPGSNPGMEIWICNSLIISFVNWAGAVFEDLPLPSHQRQATLASSSKKTVIEESSKKNQYGVVLTHKKKKIKKLNCLVHQSDRQFNRSNSDSITFWANWPDWTGTMTSRRSDQSGF